MSEDQDPRQRQDFHKGNEDGLLIQSVIPLPARIVDGGFGQSVRLQRPNDTTAYAAGDVVGLSDDALLLFDHMGPVGGGEVLLTTVKLQIDVAAVPSGMTNFLVAIYSSPPQTRLIDNAAWTAPAVDHPTLLTTISLNSPALPQAGALMLTANALGLPEQITLTQEGFWVYLVTVTGYTPAAGVVKHLTIHTAGL